MTLLRRKRRRRSGYSLIELVVVMTILTTVGLLLMQMVLQLLRFQRHHRNLIETTNVVTDVQLVVRQEVSLGLYHTRGNVRGLPPAGLADGSPVPQIFIRSQGAERALHYYPRFGDAATATLFYAHRKAQGYDLFIIRNPGWTIQQQPPFVLVSGLTFEADQFPGFTPPEPHPQQPPNAFIIMGVDRLREMTPEDSSLSPKLASADAQNIYVLEVRPRACGRLSPFQIPSSQLENLTADNPLGSYVIPVAGENRMIFSKNSIRIVRDEQSVSVISDNNLLDDLEIGYLGDGLKFIEPDDPRTKNFRILNGIALRGVVRTSKGRQPFFLPVTLRQFD